MYKPDRVILRKIKEYDPYLYIQWNSLKEYFELWREMPHGRRLITPITRDLYTDKAPQTFVELDERLVRGLVGSDSQRYGGPRAFAKLSDERWKESQIKTSQKLREKFKDLGKDAYHLINNFYVTRKTAKTGAPPELASSRPWIKPDSQSGITPRLFARTRANALAYNFKKT